MREKGFPLIFKFISSNLTEVEEPEITTFSIFGHLQSPKKGYTPLILPNTNLSGNSEGYDILYLSPTWN